MLLNFISSLGQAGTGTALPSAVLVSKNRYGAVMTFNQNTDTLQGNKNPTEFWAFLHNITCTAFLARAQLRDDGMTSTGKVAPGVYYPGDRWWNPVTQVIEVIPDHYATKWTSAGAAAFANVVAGQDKETAYPNHGQQMYDVSNGAYGLDVATNTRGASDLQEFIKVMEDEKAFHLTEFGKTPWTIAYRSNVTGTKSIFQPYILAGREARFLTSGDVDTYYGAGAGYPSNKTLRSDYLSKRPSFQYRDWITGAGVIPSGGTQEQANAHLTEQLLKTAQNNGFFVDFTHWHTAGTYTRDLMAKVREVLAPYDVHYADYEEAIRYMWARQCVANVSMAGTTVNLTWSGFDIPEALTVPVSIKVNLSGTSLEGKEITSSVGEVLKKSANVFVIEVPYQTASFTLSETETPNYIDLNPPVITYSVYQTSTITVTTDKPCRMLLWRHTRNGEEATMPVPQRSNSFNTSHNFIINTTILEGDLYIGAVTERMQSAVIGPIRHL